MYKFLLKTSYIFGENTSLLAFQLPCGYPTVNSGPDRFRVIAKSQKSVPGSWKMADYPQVVG